MENIFNAIRNNDKYNDKYKDLLNNNIIYENGMNPLHLASYLGVTLWVKELIKFIPINDLTKDNKQTAIMLAGMGGYLHCVKLLINVNADLSLMDINNNTCLQLCSTKSGKGCKRAITLALQGLKEQRMKKDDKWKTYLVPITYTSNKIDYKEKVKRNSIDWNNYKNTLIRSEISLTSNDISSTFESFRVISYNILAQCYTRPSFFPWANLDILEWNYRSQNLINEILSYNTDIICLQEVDKFEYLQENLKTFKGIYKQRTGNRKEGCAIFYNPKKFTLIDQISIDCNDFTNNKKLQTNNICLFLCLQSIQSKQDIWIGTSHFYYKNKDAREIQAKCLLDEGLKHKDYPVILCGDFNCSFSSNVIQNISLHGFLNAYDTWMNDEYCTFLGSKSGRWLDYIFHLNLISHKILSVPMKNSHTVLPSSEYSSDHIPLLVEYSFIQ